MSLTHDRDLAHERLTERGLDDVFDLCLAHLEENWGSVKRCLAAYPEYVAELRPLLDLAVALRRWPKPQQRQAAIAAGKRRMLARLARGLPAGGRNSS